MPNEMKQATRKDVAKLAGVNESIVSYVMNNNRYVSKEKRERVLAAVKELHYHPNNIARALKGKSSNHILFVADNISNEHFGKLVEEMDKTAYDKGYLISLMNYHDNPDFISRIISRQFDGVIINSSCFSEKYITQLIDCGINVVLMVNREYSSIDERAGIIYTGIKIGTKAAVELLAKKGRTNIVYVDRISPNGNFSTLTDFRFMGFYEMMNELGLEYNDQHFISGYDSEESLYKGLQERFLSGQKINGVVCRNDNIAAIVMNAIINLGLKIPEDVSIVGFDNSRLSKVLQPSLTTIEVDREQIAKSIITMLDDMIANKSVTQKYFKIKFLERNST